MIETKKEYRLGRRAFYVMTSKSMSVSLILLMFAVLLGIANAPLIDATNSLGAAFTGTTSVDSSNFVWTAISVIIALAFFIGAAGALINYLDYKNFTFSFEEFDLKVRRGIVDIQEISVPYRQIQDVDLDRGIFYRMMGVSRLVLITAGHDDPGAADETETVFDPIDASLAEDIRLLLQEKIGVQVVEGEKEETKG